MTHVTEELRSLIEVAVTIGQHRMHLDPLVGVRGPVPWVETETLRSILAGISGISVVLKWDGEKTLRVTSPGGLVLASVEMLSV